MAERGILTTLRRMTAGKMALVVSHRLAPARQADLIVVMNGVASSRPEPTKS
jgi:ABC-type multidrug transport system fused ATPase/permease subunit